MQRWKWLLNPYNVGPRGDKKREDETKQSDDDNDNDFRDWNNII